VFLCAWLESTISGYIRQYERFGIGRLLGSPGEIADIPHLLRTQDMGAPAPGAEWKALDPREFRGLLSGKRAPAGETTAP
jgi:hypothetical protein